MKITPIETHVCHARMRNWVFVKVADRSARPVRLGRGDARMAHARRRRRDRGPRAAAHRRGSDARRASLADDVPPAFLARQRHRPRHRHRRHRHRAVGHPRQGRTACRATSSGAGRCAITSAPTATWAAARWRTSTRPPADDAKRFAELARQAVADGFTAFKSMAVPPTMPLEGLKPIRYAEACVAAMRDAVGDAIDIMVDCHARPSPAMGLQFAQGARAVRSVLLRGAVLAGERRRPGGDQRGGDDADRHRRARDEPRRLPRPVRRARPARSASSTSRTAAASPRRAASPRWPRRYRIALAPHNPQGPVSTAASLEFGFAQPSYIICETVHADVPWRRTSCRKASPSRRRAASSGPTPARAWASRSTRRK